MEFLLSSFYYFFVELSSTEIHCNEAALKLQTANSSSSTI